MFQLDVLQNCYVILSLGSAMVLLLSLLMFFLVMKRKRPDQTFNEKKQCSAKYTIEHIPWLLILTWISIFVYGIITTIYSYFNPPNW